MGYTAKNHKPSPDVDVIEGELRVQNGGKISIDGANIQQAAYQADSTAVDVAGVVADLNALLAKLRAAGLMANS